MEHPLIVVNGTKGPVPSEPAVGSRWLMLSQSRLNNNAGGRDSSVPLWSSLALNARAGILGLVAEIPTSSGLPCKARHRAGKGERMDGTSSSRTPGLLRDAFESPTD